jgi:hypothetical protein
VRRARETKSLELTATLSIALIMIVAVIVIATLRDVAIGGQEAEESESAGAGLLAAVAANGEVE